MRYNHTDTHTGSIFRLHVGESSMGRDSFEESSEQPLTIVWNTSDKPKAFSLDSIQLSLKPNEVITLLASQHFSFSPADELVAWQFNREFYCIVDHDQEVSCSGLLFYGTKDTPRVMLDEVEAPKFELLLKVFEDEFQEGDNLQGEMLRMLLKRLIVKLTRIYKAQHVDDTVEKTELDIIRQFGLLVELNYKEKHQVQDYADLLHKSPKTLANLFGKFATRTPLQIIQDRISLEAKRMLIYTDASAAEVGYACGFEEPAHFSRFFKRQIGESPSGFRKAHKEAISG
ncbi:MAG: helix-turn-helix domain-containing protein [Saprospiraceae bacterium]